MTWEIIETNIDYNNEYNHGDGHTPEQLKEADKRTMLRAKEGLKLVQQAMQGFKSDYDIGFGKAGQMTKEQAIGYSEVSGAIDSAIENALNNLKWGIKALD